MLPLQDKIIVLGVTGGIAAYKAAALTSKLTQAGAKVYVIMTEGATKFVQPLTFQALSHLPVYTDTFTEPDVSVIAHIELADRADLVLVAPATANLLGKLANGIADDMLTTTLLATKAPVMIAPAMNVNMYAHPAVRENMDKLSSWGYRFIEPGEGLLACGWVGKGRLAEPEEIVEVVKGYFAGGAGELVAAQPSDVAQPSAVHPQSNQSASSLSGSTSTSKPPRDLTGLKILVTAGPTREKIDPVRYITNHASGKMGYAIAEAARDRGADVVLVSGPTALPKPDGVTFVAVESVQEMLDACLAAYPDTDMVVKSAAVSDYRPKVTHEHKMKKTGDNLTIEMEKAPDILKTLGEQKDGQFLIGFAAETQDLTKYALDKIARKNLDMIVANNVLQEGAGMGGDTNIVTIFSKDGDQVALDKMSKRAVADELFDFAIAKMQARVTG